MFRQYLNCLNAAFLGVDRKAGDLSNRYCPILLEVQVNCWTLEVSQIF